MAQSRKNGFWISAGLINLATFLIHLLGGQPSLVNPLLNSSLTRKEQTEWLGVWHLVSLTLLASSALFLFAGWKSDRLNLHFTILFLSLIYIGFGFIFIVLNLGMQVFAPQWILLLPVGIAGLTGYFRTARKMKKPATEVI